MTAAGIAAELARWHAKCDEVGVPHNPDSLVRHHIGNAKLLGYMQARLRYEPVIIALRNWQATDGTAKLDAYYALEQALDRLDNGDEK